jgi:hypothetical protein
MSAHPDSTLYRFIAKLRSEGASCAVEEHRNGTLVQIRRFGYWFNGNGKLNGGFVQACAEDWQAEWREWADRLGSKVSIYPTNYGSRSENGEAATP